MAGQIILAGDFATDATATLPYIGSLTGATLPGSIGVNTSVFQWGASVANSGNQIGFAQSQAVGDNPTATMLIAAQSAPASALSNFDGGGLYLRSGNAFGVGATGHRGPVRMQFGNNANTMVEIAEVNPGQRLVALLQGGTGISTLQIPVGAGDKVLWIGNAGTVPSANANNGGLLYVSAGALTWRGSSGTVTVLGPA